MNLLWVILCDPVSHPDLESKANQSLLKTHLNYLLEDENKGALNLSQVAKGPVYQEFLLFWEYIIR